MKLDINRFFKGRHVEAAELFSAGWCNLECQYCYIPKTDVLKTIHAEIIECIKDGRYLNMLEDLYGDGLTSICHWGTEPTLTTELFKDFYKQAVNIFPKLKFIKMSSNFMTSPQNLISFINSLPTSRELDIGIQISHDGPDFTDKNRQGGSKESIRQNSISFIAAASELSTPHKISINFKPTVTDADIKCLADIEVCKKYYDYFDDYLRDCFNADKNNKIDILNVVDPTIVCPGNYTTEDGKNFYKLILNQAELKKCDYKHIARPESNYFYRLSSTMPFWGEYFTKQRMFTCSAGDSNLGIGPNEMHICHQTFYLNKPGYFDAVREYSKKGHSYFDPVSDGLEKGNLNLLRDTCVIKTDEDVAKFFYRTRSFHDFTACRVASTTALIYEMARIGQINCVYSDQYLSNIFAMFMTQVFCPVDQITVTGSLNSAPTTIIRLFGNGAFEEILLKTIRERIQ